MSSSDPRPTGHLVGRLTAAFVLDAIEMTRRGDPEVEDLLDNLILVATLQANVAPLARDLGLQRTYGSRDSLPPDELRSQRAMSVNALANSLRLPHETVRRRILRLAALGRCVVTPNGVYIPQAVFSTPGYEAVSWGDYELVRALFHRLRDLAILPPPAGSAPPEGPPPVLAVVRALIDYVMRALDDVRKGAGDVMAAVILLGILRANTEHLPDRPRRGAGAPEDFIPDADRRPVSAVSLAARLGLPRETVRRHVARLADQGECLRRPDGLVVPSDIHLRPGGVLFSPTNLANLNRMFAGLDELGVLAAWEAERA
ncbi:MAG: hypothetical protein ABW360_02140 [Phenylobacterium sp.]